MRRVLPLLAATVLGCASSSVTADPVDRPILSDRSGITRSALVPAVRDTFSVGADQLMRALVGAYQDAGIPVTLVDPAGHRLGNPNFTAMRKLSGAVMSDLLSCGANALGESRANTSKISMSVVSTVHPSTPTASVVETQVLATAAEVQSGNSIDPLPCSSTGKLEGQLHRAARAKVQ